MTFGKHQGEPVQHVPTSYLSWVLRVCHNVNADLRAAIGAELARRGIGRRHLAGRPDHPGEHVGPVAATLPVHAEARAAVFALLSDLLRAGIRVVARGEGCVHVYGGRLSPELRARLARQHGDLDGLVRLVRWSAPGQPRSTPATTVLARLRRDGTDITALPDGTLRVEPAPATDPLAELTQGDRRELWFRLAAGVPEPDVPTPSVGADHPGVLAGLHGFCIRRAAKCTSAGDDDRVRRWRAWAAAVAAMRGGQCGCVPGLAELIGHCLAQAERLERCGKAVASAKWRRWVGSLGWQ